ncbi:MAG TPA: DNA methyltransferase [Gemmataceae bacterium]|nr:DNA methyltransferase [Gemmataceae bacterium]
MGHEQPDFDGVFLDRTTVAQALLNIDNKQRSNLLPWNGQFSPQLIEVLLRTYAPKNGLVLDPFAGSGTVLYEAGSLGMPVVGAEINPAACKMAEIYCLINASVAKRRALMTRLERLLEDCLPAAEPSLFSTTGNGAQQCIKESLVAIHGGLDDRATRSLLEALIVLLDFYKDVSGEKVYSTWAKLKARVLGLPESDAPIRLLNCDARRLPLRDGETGFVVTSPPYINVFNYHQQYRRSVEALGWDLLKVAESEIGSNRKHRQNRFLTVIQYCLDMTDVLREIQRVCKEGSRAIVIVGRESNVRKTRFFNGEIMAALASRCVGFLFAARQERVFMNRFGEQIYEDLLHFDVTRRNTNHEEPREIAREVLAKAKARAPEESLGDLEEAISVLEGVGTSPIYDPTAASSPSRRRRGREAKT